MTVGYPGMAIDTRTIAELEKIGFTRIDARCAGCGRIVQMPFRMLLARKQITTGTTVAELRRRYRCQTCGSSQAALFAPWRTRGQYLTAWGPPADTRPTARSKRSHALGTSSTSFAGLVVAMSKKPTRVVELAIQNISASYCREIVRIIAIVGATVFLLMQSGPIAAAERVRIVALGDSLTAGHGLARSAAFPARLEAAL